MKNNSISINKMVIGVFFLIWATFAFVLIGTIGRYLSLVLGMYCIMSSVVFGKIDSRSFFFILKAIAVFLMYIFLAFELNQRTTSIINITFGLICLLLIIAGYLYSKNTRVDKTIDSKIVVLIAILSILGAFELYRMQASLLLEVGRGLGEESLNAVGVAYVCGQVFLLLFWLYIQMRNLILKILLITAMVANGVALLITESRGAVVFLIVTLIWFYKERFKFLLNLKSIVVIALVGTLLLLTFKDNVILQDKIDDVSNRFESAFDHLQGINTDASLQERSSLQSDFYEDYDQMVFGYEGYKPYPHNQIIEIYMRWGIFGIPVLLISLLSFIKSIRYPSRKDFSQVSFSYLIISVFFFSYLQSMSSLSLEMNRMLWFGFGFFITELFKRKIKIVKVNG
ncbi:hypothetical protein [Flavicella sp.]|uniref:O-antigen ligase family protein n=1 Tax=Flavicella sp. TaxID=2957742 RepID=UPI003018E441